MPPQSYTVSGLVEIDPNFNTVQQSDVYGSFLSLLDQTPEGQFLASRYSGNPFKGQGNQPDGTILLMSDQDPPGVTAFGIDKVGMFINQVGMFINIDWPELTITDYTQKYLASSVTDLPRISGPVTVRESGRFEGTAI